MAFWLFLVYSIPISCTSVRPRGLGVFLPAVLGHQAQSAISIFPAATLTKVRSRDIFDHKPAARPSFGGTQLRSADAGADRGAGGRGDRPRSARLRANRLRQNRRLWLGRRQGIAGWRRAIRA